MKLTPIMRHTNDFLWPWGGDDEWYPMPHQEYALANTLESFGYEINNALYMAIGMKDIRTVAEQGRGE